MKKTICLFITAALIGCASGQNTNLPVPEWKMTVKVVDEAGEPVTNALVRIWYHLPATETETIVMTNKAGHTDSNGVFSSSARSTTVELTYEASKAGYYSSGRSYELGLPFDYDPVRWNPSVNLVLKRILQPISMYAKRIEKGPPVFNEPVGYDMVAGDWVAPHGKGQIADISFKKEHSEKSPDDYDAKLIIVFPNSGDGIQEFSIAEDEKGGGMRSPHEAPQNGYEPKLAREFIRHAGQQIRFDYDEKRNYFFRVRTVLDENGKVKSALYGKIYGDFMRFRYYLNPTPNSRNVEFDPKQNLLKGLSSLERVDAP